MTRAKFIASKPYWKHSFQKFTKGDAQRALDKVSPNRDRSIDEAWVAALARTMDMGLWEPFRPSQKPLAFDVDGNRINGQHRLLAFLRSKLTELVFPVVTGCRPEDYETFDQDEKARTKRAAHPDISFVTRDQARIAWLDKLTSGVISRKMTQPVFRKLWDVTWHKQIQWSIEVMPGASGHQRAPFVVAFMYVHKADPEFAEKMARAWVDGIGLPPAMHRLRDLAIRSRPKGGTGAVAMIRATLRILNALAPLHRGEQGNGRIYENLAGLRYFSELMRDGSIARWSKTNPVEEVHA